MEGLTEGRMVHFVMQNGEHRPAVVVKVWNTDGTANLQVWTDGANDTWGVPDSDQRKSAIEHGHFWATSVPFNDTDKGANTWHWIERA